MCNISFDVKAIHQDIFNIEIKLKFDGAQIGK